MFLNKSIKKPLLDTKLLEKDNKTNKNSPESLEHINIGETVSVITESFDSFDTSYNSFITSLEADDEEDDTVDTDDVESAPEDSDSELSDDSDDSGDMDAFGDDSDDGDGFGDDDSDDTIEETDDETEERLRKGKLIELFSELETSVIKTNDRLAEINNSTITPLIVSLRRLLQDITKYIDVGIHTDKSSDILANLTLFKQEYAEYAEAVKATLDELV